MLFWATRSHSGSARNLDPFFQKYGPSERILSGSRAASIFFRRYGVYSVFIGRFLGPLRAVVPLVAGMMHMPPLRFYTANVLSAAVWASALMLLGDLLTRSLGQENLATKIFYFTIVAAAVTALGFWIRRQFLVG